MRAVFILSGILALAMIFWASIAWLMGYPSAPVALWLMIISIVIFLGAGFIKNHLDHRKFQLFLEAQRNDDGVQEKLKNEKIRTAGTGSGAAVRNKYRESKTGVEWMPANVHGAVPKRRRRRPFLPKN